MPFDDFEVEKNEKWLPVALKWVDLTTQAEPNSSVSFTIRPRFSNSKTSRKCFWCWSITRLRFISWQTSSKMSTAIFHRLLQLGCQNDWYNSNYCDILCIWMHHGNSVTEIYNSSTSTGRSLPLEVEVLSTLRVKI